MKRFLDKMIQAFFQVQLGFYLEVKKFKLGLVFMKNVFSVRYKLCKKILSNETGVQVSGF